jgi:hypothetical protein
VSEEDDVSAIFFLGGKYAVMIGIKETEYVFVSALSASVLEDAYVGSFRNRLLDAFCELDGAVMRIVMTDEAADETDHNIGRG